MRTPDIKDLIRQLAADISDEVTGFRNHLHAHPELSMREEETARFISGVLSHHGIPFTTGWAGHGVVGIIEGQNPEGKVVALRADMDALPIQEENDIPNRSVNDGVMHACGHDVHMASLLGTAIILNRLRTRFAGKVKLIFQPSEEVLPGGAIQMIEAGVLKNPEVEMIIGQHVTPQKDTGKVGFREGKYMASADEIYLTVKGKGGHGAMPETNIDPVLIASHIIVGLQQVVSRRLPASLPAVLSFGRFVADGQTNVIPSEVKIAGTFRTFDEEWRLQGHAAIRDVAEGIARSMGGECEVNIVKGYPALVNDRSVTSAARKAAIAYLGEAQVEELDIRPTAEDFAHYGRYVPSCFYRLGVRNEAKGIVHGQHTPLFNADDDALETGTGTMAYIALELLAGN